MESPVQGTSSPSASSIFLPLGRKSRRGSRASVNTQTERENLTEALDQIHNAASQLDTLTVFNEFTTPPVPSSTSDNKTLVGDLQGGLSGLYSMFRASVGGVRDIVGGQAKPPDAPPEASSTAASNSSARNPASNDDPLSGLNSAVASKSQSPVLGTFPPSQDGFLQHSAPKSSKLSSKAGSVSSKASIPPSNALKLPLAPLTKVRAPATADPTVTEVNVNAVKDGSHHNRSNSGSLSVSLLAGPDSAGLDRKDSGLHMSSGQISQDSGASRSQSPVMLAKTQRDSFRENREAEPARLHSLEAPLYDPAPSSYQSTGNGHPKNLQVDTSFTGNAPRRKHTESDHGVRAPHHENQAGNSNISLIDNSPASTSMTNSVSKLAASESTIHDGRTATTLATSFTTTDPEGSSPHSSKTSLRKPSEKLPTRVTQPRLPGREFPQRHSSETTETRSTFTPPSNFYASQSKTLDKIGSFTPRRLSDIHDANSGIKSKLLGRQFWMRDENAKDCFCCGEPFSTFRRKHHCRICGQIFDAKCTTLISGVPFGQPGSVRVCKPCEMVINASGDDSSDYSADELHSPALMSSRASEYFGTPRGAESSSLRPQPRDQVLKTPTMAIPATRRTVDGNNRRSAILEIDSDRQLTRPTSSRSLRSSLTSRTHSVSHKRHQSRSQYVRNFKPYHEDQAPFQRQAAEEANGERKLPAFHRDNIIDPDLAQYLSDDDSSGEDEPSLFSVVNDGSLSRSGGDGERASFGGLLAAVKKGRSRFSDRPGLAGLYPGRDMDDGSASSSKAVNFPRSTRRRNLSVASSIHQRLPSRNPRESHQSAHFHHDHSVVPFAPHTPSPSGGKMTRSASMRGAGAPVVELNRASQDHVRKLLRQLIHDAGVPHPHSWETALLPILLKATDDVEPNVQNGDDMDIRHYVKLKKITGGRPADTSYVSGLVFTKNLALKSMPRSIPHPRILVITFPLEYARQQQHFMSLEPVIRQEREFLESLVNRIAALRPTLLLVEKNVSGLALQLLEKANIATAYNVKESIIEAVSRCTQTRIITSVDRLAATPAHLGQCASFDLRTYVQGNRKKTYMYISGCAKELGCTIVLRGATNDVLVKIKRITEFMVYVVYNLKLETCLMRDEFAKIPTSPSDSNQNPQQPKGTQEAQSHTLGGHADKGSMDGDHKQYIEGIQGIQDDVEVPQGFPDLETVGNGNTTKMNHNHSDLSVPAFYEDMVEKHETKILSASPFVKFAPPYLLMRARKLERELDYLKRLRDQDFSYEPNEKSKDEKFFLITPEMIHESLSGASSKVKEVLHAVHDAEYDRALHHYQTQKRQWEAYISGNINLFDPYAHQNIVVLYSLVCTKTSVPCSGPDIFALGFYNQYGADRMFEGDCTLGQYVEDLCHSATTVCSANGCEERMFDHHRQYVHGEAQISVFVQPYPSKLRGLQDSILMWSACKICGNEVPAMPMSESTWKYSFGKYLEQSFFSADLHARAGVCPHDLHRDHLRYFGFKDVALRIHYDPINLLEIIVPRPRVTWKVDKDLKLRNDIYSKTERRLARYMASVKARLKSINVDSVIPQMAQACRKEIEVLTKRVNDEHASLIKHHQEWYMNTKYWEIIPLNKALLATQEKVVEWDATFAEFEKNYFPSEKDIRRLATLQLKKIFLDRDESVSSLTSTEESAITPTEPDESGITPSGTPKIPRRMTLSAQEAKNVLESVVEEHTAHIDDDTEMTAETPLPPGSPVEDITEGPATPASSKQVQHLDLAIPTNLAEKLSPPRVAPGQSILPENDQTTSPVSTSFGEGSQEARDTLLNRPETVTKEDSKATSPQRNSGIPRPRERTFHHGFRAKSPPLLRAQSQPVQTQQGMRAAQSTAMVGRANEMLKEASGDISSTKPKKEKRFSDRLKLTSLKSPKMSSGHSLIPRSVAKKANNRVSYLARHFEQLSRDFEKERIKERKQRAAQGKQSRAYPMASSKPIVEVYKSVRDAVEERGPSDDEFLSSTPPTAPPKSPTSPGNAIFPGSSAADMVEEAPDRQDTEPRPSEESLRESAQSLSEGEGEDDRSDGDKSLSEGTEKLEPSEEVASISPEELPLDLPKDERNSLVKMLTIFWAERSASGWAPLDYPLSDADHVFADCDIIVREDEPSSLIAFALNSEDYQNKLKSIQVQDLSETSEGEEGQGGVEQSLLRSTGTHLKYQFQEGQAKMLCKVFYAEQFDALRRKCGIADRIVESLSRCMKWDSKGGKTKSLFLKTLDERFILKSLSTTETQAFLKFAPDYFQIMSEALFHELPSAIAKMFGFYQVIVKNTATGVEYNWFLLMMENLFYDRTPTRIFDLKGSMRNRKVQSTGERNEVLLDENMVEFIYESPLFTREHSKKLLSQSLWNDTLFLARQNVMDYSLMIAIDENRQELVVGIIDCIRTYTWDKKLESWIKDRGFAGGGKNRPTVTSPKEYKSRFREAMARYVLQAPDSWHQFHVADLYRRVPRADIQRRIEPDIEHEVLEV